MYHKYNCVLLLLLCSGFVAAQPAFNIPGFYNEDGTRHEIIDPLWPWADTINVLDFGADPADNASDDRPAIEDALNAAGQGDVVWFPNGVYNLMSTASNYDNAHLSLTDAESLHGESREGAIIKSQFPIAVNENETSRTVRLQGVYACTIKNLTFTSDFSGTYWTDRVSNNPDRSAPGVHLYIDDSGSTPSRRIVVENCSFEKYRAVAIRLANSSDCIVRNSSFELATDVGGGGAGYGISIQGNGHGVDSYGLFRDSRYNLVENCTFTGPHIRHGVVIQYFSHNNLVRNNVLHATSMDALDLHGEDEYNNELCYNTVTDVLLGGGVGVGNTGAEHDASGYNNYIHHNTFRNCREGVRVYLGSPYTRIEGNIVENSAIAVSRGLYIQNAPHTTIKDNIIRNNLAGGFRGIHLVYDSGTLGAHYGDPENIWIDGNQVYNNAYGIVIDDGKSIYYGPNNSVYNNTVDTLFAADVTWQKTSQISPESLPFQANVMHTFPNPFNTAFVVELNLVEQGWGDLSLLDIRGRKIAKIYAGNMNAGTSRWQVNVPALSSGIYLINLQQGSVTRTQKIILDR